MREWTKKTKLWTERELKDAIKLHRDEGNIRVDTLVILYFSVGLSLPLLANSPINI